MGYDPALFPGFPDLDQGESPLVIWSMGVRVSLWVEKGVLFELTEEPEVEGAK